MNNIIYKIAIAIVALMAAFYAAHTLNKPDGSTEEKGITKVEKTTPSPTTKAIKGEEFLEGLRKFDKEKKAESERKAKKYLKGLNDYTKSDNPIFSPLVKDENSKKDKDIIE